MSVSQKSCILFHLNCALRDENIGNTGNDYRALFKRGAAETLWKFLKPQNETYIFTFHKRNILSILLSQVPSSLKRKKLSGFIISSIQAESGHEVTCELQSIICTILRPLNNWVMASRTHLLLKQLSLLITKFSTLKQFFSIFPVNPGIPCSSL